MATDYRYNLSCAPEDKEWDSFLAQTSGGHHVQTSLWAQVKSTIGWKALRIVVRQEERIVGGAQILMRRILSGTLAIVSKGPVLLSDDAALAHFVINALLQVTKEEGIGCLVVQPPNNGEALVQLLCETGFQPMTLEVAPTASIQIDLKPDLSQILAAMKKQTRRDIRHGLNSGVIGREGTEEDLGTFCRLLRSTSERKNWSVYPYEYFAEIMGVFGSRGMAKIFIVEYEGKAVSSQILIAFGDTVIAKNSGWTGQCKSLGPNNVLEWASIIWAKARGYRYYDLEGIAPRVAMSRIGMDVQPDPTDQWCCYKFKYGGELKLFPKAHVYHHSPLAAWMYKNFLSVIERRSLGRNIMSLIRLH